MRERIAALRSVWRSSPIAAKLAFGTAIVTFVYYLLFALTTAVMGTTSAAPFDLPGPALILMGLVSGIIAFVSLAAWAIGPQILIGLALRARSSIARWAGTLAAALIAAVAAFALIKALTTPITPGDQQTGTGLVLEYMLWAPFIAIGAVYAVVAALGFRDAATGGGLRKSGGQGRSLTA